MNPYFRSAKSALSQHFSNTNGFHAPRLPRLPVSVLLRSRIFCNKDCLSNCRYRRQANDGADHPYNSAFRHRTLISLGSASPKSLRQWLSPIYRVTSWRDRRSHSAKHWLNSRLRFATTMRSFSATQPFHAVECEASASPLLESWTRNWESAVT